MIKKYSPEIDSLRAIAVISVIIYHAKIYLFGYALLPGGYYGVDIFFVISGYLITSKIFFDLKNNRFSFNSFYLKRARRILPALFFTFFISFAFSWFSLMPNQFIDFAKSSLFTIGFISNYFFYFSGLEYGAVSGLLKPILHTWSLGIEEQFYIIFPLIFYFAYKNFRKYLLLSFSFIFIFSFSFAVFFSFKDPILNFFLLPSRMWELLLGALIFFIKYQNSPKISKFTSNFIVFLGLALIILSFVFIYDFYPTPNIKTLLPLSGASLIIFFYKKEGLLNKFIINKLVIWIGLSSYSLYLIHYPVFAFVRSLSLATTTLEFFLVALLIFIISFLSYFFIEKPFRNTNLISDKIFIKIIISILVVISIASVAIINNDGFKNRFPNSNVFSLDYQKYLREVNNLKYEIGNPQFKDLKKKNVLVIGDSHGRGTFNALKLNEDLFENFEFSIIDVEIECLKTINDSFKICNNYMTKLQKNIFLDSELIIMSTSYSDIDLLHLDDVIKNLNSYNKKIIIFSNKPGFYFENYKSFVDRFFLENKKLPQGEDMVQIKKKYFNSIDSKSKKVNVELKKIATNYGIYYFDTSKLICNYEESVCEFITKNNEKIIFDDFHYTIEGAKYIGQKIFKLGWLDEISSIN